MRSWILTTAMALTLIATAGGQQQGKKPKPDEEASVSHFNGPDIPDFIAWKAFFERADYEYRLGTGCYKNWVKSQVGLGAFLKDDPVFSKSLMRLLPDQGMLVVREEERLRNQASLNSRMVKYGSISPEERVERYLDLVRQEVRLVQKAHEELHASIMNSQTPQRESIWARIVEHVHIDVKNSIGITRDNMPADLDRWEVYFEFKEVKQ